MGMLHVQPQDHFRVLVPKKSYGFYIIMFIASCINFKARRIYVYKIMPFFQKL